MSGVGGSDGLFVKEPEKAVSQEEEEREVPWWILEMTAIARWLELTE